MFASQLFNPCEYGRIKRGEAEGEKVPYVRNSPNKGLREYVKEKFNITTDDFHFEEGPDEWILVINSKNEVVNVPGQTQEKKV